jgi:hypothetical protein
MTKCNTPSWQICTVTALQEWQQFSDNVFLFVDIASSKGGSCKSFPLAGSHRKKKMTGLYP